MLHQRPLYNSIVVIYNCEVYKKSFLLYKSACSTYSKIWLLLLTKVRLDCSCSHLSNLKSHQLYRRDWAFILVPELSKRRVIHFHIDGWVCGIAIQKWKTSFLKKIDWIRFDITVVSPINIKLHFYSIIVCKLLLYLSQTLIMWQKVIVHCQVNNRAKSWTELVQFMGSLWPPASGLQKHSNAFRVDHKPPLQTVQTPVQNRVAVHEPGVHSDGFRTNHEPVQFKEMLSLWFVLCPYIVCSLYLHKFSMWIS